MNPIHKKSSTITTSKTISRPTASTTTLNDYISHQQQQQFRVAKNMIDLNLPNRTTSAKLGTLNSQQRGDLSSVSSPPTRFLDEILVQGKRSSVASHNSLPISTTPNNLQLSTITVINRSNEEKTLFPDKLILERKNLIWCPVIEGEASFRLINYQHNQIKSIANLDQMRNLIFLDLYNNHIDKIAGLSSLIQLRVLMLGKNRISKIENLNTLVYLDILDLHANQVR